jgi:N,N'-diacetyllegionaminate synthase
VEKRLVDAVRRSICINADRPAGHVIGEEDLVWLRPAGGIAPGDEATVVGRTLARDLAAGDRITLEDLA